MQAEPELLGGIVVLVALLFGLLSGLGEDRADASGLITSEDGRAASS